MDVYLHKRIFAEWIYLAHDWDKWQYVAYKVMNVVVV
jgi:hypothetical protein